MPVFRRTKRGLLLIAVPLLSSMLLAACSEPASILDTAGPVASSESFLFWIILGIATLVFLCVEGALVYSIVRFRDRPGTPNPKQNHGNLKIELIWTIIPTIFLLIILVFTIRGLFQVAPESEPADAHKVSVTAVGHQWWWEFHYNDYNITTADTLHVPVGTVIHVNLFSNNVIHSFWVPQLTGKTDLIPGHNNQKWFKADQPGTYEGICAEYCGAQHGNMRFTVQVDSADTFQTWITTQNQHAVTPAAGSLAAQGLETFKGAGACSGCHGIMGVNATSYVDTAAVCDDSKPQNEKNNECLLGPNLTHFGSRGLIAGGVLENNTDKCNVSSYSSFNDLLANCNLAKWLHDPQAVKPGNDMVINLTNQQVEQLVAYLETLK